MLGRQLTQRNFVWAQTRVWWLSQSTWTQAMLQVLGSNPCPLDKPLSKQLLNKDSSWDSLLCGCFPQLSFRNVTSWQHEEQPWYDFRSFLFTHPNSPPLTTGHLRCLYHDLFQLKAPTLDILLANLKFSLFIYSTFPQNSLYMYYKYAIKGKFLASDSLGYQS